MTDDLVDRLELSSLPLAQEAAKEINRRGEIIRTLYFALVKINELGKDDVFDERCTIATKAMKKVNPDYGKD